MFKDRYQHMLMEEFEGEGGSAPEASADDSGAELETDLELDSAEEDSEEDEEVELSGEEDDSEDDSEHVANSEAETEEELQDELEAAAAAGASTEELKSMVRKFELKVNGRTVEREIDLSDEEAIKRELQKSMAFTEKAKEAKELQQTYQKALEELINDPISALAELGVNVDDIAAGHIMKKIEDEQKTPEQREREKIQKELEEYREKLKKIEDEKNAIEQARMQEQQMAQLQEEIDNAWKMSNVTIPKNPKFISRAADALDWAESQVDEITGEPLFPDVTIADVLPLVEQEYFEEIGSFIKEAPEDFLEKYSISRKAKKEAQKKKITPPVNVSSLNKDSSKSKQSSSQPKEKERSVSSADFFKKLQEQYNA